MSSPLTLRERLRDGLRRTRERLGIALGPAETPDWEALEESLVLADVGVAAAQEILEAVRSRQGEVRDRLGSVLLGSSPGPSVRTRGSRLPG